MNPLVLFFIFGAATATTLVPGLEKEGIDYVRTVEVPVVEQVVGVQNVGVTGVRASQVGNGVGVVTGGAETPIVGKVSEGVVGTQYPLEKTISGTYGTTGKIFTTGIVPTSGVVGTGVEYPVVRSGVEYPAVGSGVEYPVFKSGVEYPVVGSGVKYPVVGSRVEYPIVGSGVEYPVFKSGVEYPVVGSGVKYPVVGSRVEYPVLRSGVEYPVLRSGVEYPVIKNKVEYPVVQKIPTYGQVEKEYGYKPIFRAFPHLYYDYPVHQTYPIVKPVQYPFLDSHLEQDVYRTVPFYQKQAQLLRAFPYLYNRQYPVESEVVKTGLQYGERLVPEAYHGVQTPYLKNIRQTYPLVYNREYTGVRDAQVSETVAPIFRDIPVGKYEPFENKFSGKQYNPIYRAFPHLYSQEYPTQFEKTYKYGKFPVTHSYKPFYGQDYFNTRFLDQDVFERHVQEYPVYNKGFKYFPYLNEKYPVYKHEYPIYKHEYPIYENNYVYKKYPQVYEPIEHTELPLDYEVPFKTGYPVHQTLDKPVSTFY